MRSTSTRLAVAAAVMLSAACSDTILDPTDGAPADRQVDGRQAPPDGLHFNPQPEPPADLLRVDLVGQPAGSLHGRYVADGRSGGVVVETAWSRRTATGEQLAQRWTIHPPDPIHARDSSVPPDPIIVDMTGHLDAATGRLVMSGQIKGYDVTVVAIAAKGGAGSVGGDVMFDPQPDPPKTLVR